MIEYLHYTQKKFSGDSEQFSLHFSPQNYLPMMKNQSFPNLFQILRGNSRDQVLVGILHYFDELASSKSPILVEEVTNHSNIF